MGRSADKLLATWAVAAACSASPPDPAPTGQSPTPAVVAAVPAVPAVPAAVATTTANLACSSLISFPLAPGVPHNPFISAQQDADCVGWWEFVTLNWPTGGASFGRPGDTTPVFWETFLDAHLLFQPNAQTPPDFASEPTIPADCAAAGAGGLRVLRAGAKFTTEFQSTDSAEAFPFSGPNWLGAQNGTNVWYEVRVSEDEYDTIKTHGLYDASVQQSYVDNGSGAAIDLPPGTASPAPGQLGALELKAAWMEVPDPNDARWSRYKLSAAAVVDLQTNTCRRATVALVGLHILHKTAYQPTWIWATFEHVDNVPPNPLPSPPPSPPPGGYNFYDPACQPRQITATAACLPAGVTSPVTVACTPNTAPPYDLGPGCPAPVPIQVTRANALDTTVLGVNARVQQAIAQAYPDSVWQYYQLVNVIWSTAPTQSAAQPRQAPLTLAGMLPTTRVANVTMETYAQSFTCTDCHQHATIAPTAAQPTPPWASDFSFLLGTACTAQGCIAPPAAPLARAARTSAARNK